MHIGLFLGSFNPIHYGHLIIASYMFHYYNFNEIWFVISPHNPMKEDAELLDEQIRLQMVEMAICNQDNFKALDIELSLPRPSYTINTLNVLKSKYSSYKFSLIVGYDNIVTFDKWKDYNNILERHKVYVYPRISNEHYKNSIEQYESIIMTKAPIIEISSTFIRKAISQGLYLDYFTTIEVLNFIKTKQLYKK